MGKISQDTKIIVGSLLSIFVIIYICIALFFSDRFLFKTTVNGVSCVGKTIQQVKDLTEQRAEKYVLTLQEANSVTEKIVGADFDLKVKRIQSLESTMQKQNAFLWISSVFRKDCIDMDVELTYNEEVLSDLISTLECLNLENQVDAISAKPVILSGKVEIEPEVEGTVIKTEVFQNEVRKAVNKLESNIDLRKQNCYVAPRFTTKSKEVSLAKSTMEHALKAKITYELDGNTMILDKTKISTWLSTDDSMNVIVLEGQVGPFLEVLGETYNTKPRSNQMITPIGKVVEIDGATKGRMVGVAEELSKLREEILSGTVATREPIIVQHPTPEGEYAWGSTYIEVDLSAQHMWYIYQDNVVFETDIVTGSPGRDTPTGIFEILKKKRNKILTGNIVPETGQPEYRTPVSYWARVTWSGIGFHDATWQPAFGQEIYKQGYGSHGCINMPLEAIEKFYNLISVGCPVIIHY